MKVYLIILLTLWCFISSAFLLSESIIYLMSGKYLLFLGLMHYSWLIELMLTTCSIATTFSVTYIIKKQIGIE